ECSKEQQGIRRLGALVYVCLPVRSLGRFTVDRGSCSCGAWWESDRPGLHGRSKRRLPLQSPLQDGSCKSADITEPRGWAGTKRRVRDSRGQVRSARQQAIDRRDNELLRVPRHRNRLARRSEDNSLPGTVCFQHCNQNNSEQVQSPAILRKIRPWKGLEAWRRDSSNYLLLSS